MTGPHQLLYHKHLLADGETTDKLATREKHLLSRRRAATHNTQCRQPKCQHYNSITARTLITTTHIYSQHALLRSLATLCQ